MKRWTEVELNRLYRYALSLTGERDAAFDLTQAALLRWIETSNAAVDEPLRYVLSIIRNLHFDHCRHEKRLKQVPLDEIGPLDLDLAPLEQAQADADEVRWLLGELGDAERELLYLWAVEGYTIDEISNHTATPRGTLLSRLHRMRRRLIDRRATRDAETRQ